MEIPFTGNVWKLGCKWGSKNPSFYEMIKERSIVIGVNDQLYSPGDLIVITEGHTIYALGKILENAAFIFSPTKRRSAGESSFCPRSVNTIKRLRIFIVT